MEKMHHACLIVFASLFLPDPLGAEGERRADEKVDTLHHSTV